jgi:hypothetical protein
MEKKERSKEGIKRGERERKATVSHMQIEKLRQRYTDAFSTFYESLKSRSLTAGILKRLTKASALTMVATVVALSAGEKQHRHCGDADGRGLSSRTSHKRDREVRAIAS